MLASEALYDGHPVAHIVQWEERQRLARIATTAHRIQRERRWSRRFDR